jgi:hypothetical protein
LKATIIISNNEKSTFVKTMADKQEVTQVVALGQATTLTMGGGNYGGEGGNAAWRTFR